MGHQCRGPSCPWLSTAVGQSTTETVGQHIYTQAVRLESTQTAHVILAWSCQAGSVGGPALLPAHSGARGNEQVEPWVTQAQTQAGGGVPASAYGFPAAFSLAGTFWHNLLIRKKLLPQLRGRKGHRGPGAVGGSWGPGLVPPTFRAGFSQLHQGFLFPPPVATGQSFPEVCRACGSSWAL